MHDYKLSMFTLEYAKNTHIIDNKAVDDSRGPFNKHSLTLIAAWISNYINYEMWDELNYPLINFHGEPLKFRNG